MLPIANSDHCISSTDYRYPHNTVPIVHYDRVSNILNNIDWWAAFSNCIRTDDFANVFTSQLYSAMNWSKTYKQHCKQERLPKQIVQMLRCERRAWTTATQSNDYTAFQKISKSFKARIRQYHCCKESRIIHSYDLKSFFSYIYSKSSNQNRTVHFSTMFNCPIASPPSFFYRVL